MFTTLTRELLQKLIDAEKRGKPLTATDLGNEVRGTTFRDAWESGYINQDSNGAAVLSESGKRWLESNKGPKNGTF